MILSKFKISNKTAVTVVLASEGYPNQYEKNMEIKINVSDNVEKVFYSLSKPFGLQNIRTGWYFSRKPDIKLYKLHIKTKYYNYFAHQCAEEIIKNFPIDYVYNKLNAQQKSVCNNLNINQSDSVWLGYSYDDNYTKFRRNNEIARLCLTNYFKNYHDKT